MPLYAFACQECEHTFETLVFNGESVECPECHGDRLEKLPSVPARPKQALPTPCDSSLPPCGPGCCRL